MALPAACQTSNSDRETTGRVKSGPAPDAGKQLPTARDAAGPDPISDAGAPHDTRDGLSDAAVALPTGPADGSSKDADAPTQRDCYLEARIVRDPRNGGLTARQDFIYADEILSAVVDSVGAEAEPDAGIVPEPYMVVTTFDTAGRVTGLYNDCTGREQWNHSYSYDALRRWCSNGKGYEYSEAGLLVEQSFFSEDPTGTVTYDTRGRPLRVETLDNGVMYVTTYEYDGDYLVREETVDTDIDDAFATSYTTTPLEGDSGLMVREVDRGDDGSVDRVEYLDTLGQIVVTEDQWPNGEPVTDVFELGQSWLRFVDGELSTRDSSENADILPDVWRRFMGTPEDYADYRLPEESTLGVAASFQFDGTRLIASDTTWAGGKHIRIEFDYRDGRIESETWQTEGFDLMGPDVAYEWSCDAQ